MQFTTYQAANSQENLERAGVKTKEILVTMPPLLNMAPAEGMDLSTVASNKSITGQGESMKYIASIVIGPGIWFEQMVALLGIMDNAGIKGSQSGTVFRAALTK